MFSFLAFRLLEIQKVAGPYAHLHCAVIKLLHLLLVFLYSLEMRSLWMTTLIAVALFAQVGPAVADRAKARQLTTLAARFAAEGHVDRALNLCQQAISSDPDYQQPYELALPLWLRTGREAEARRNLEHLTLRAPTTAFAWYALGAIYRREGRFDLAVLAYRAYLGRRPTDPDGRFGLAMALVALEDQSAAEALERYVESETRSERQAYRQEALRLLAERRFRTRIDKHFYAVWQEGVRRYFETIRPWLEVLRVVPSDVVDAGRESSPGTTPR